jgi:hypothetical protein
MLPIRKSRPKSVMGHYIQKKALHVDARVVFWLPQAMLLEDSKFIKKYILKFQNNLIFYGVHICVFHMSANFHEEKTYVVS